MKRFSFIFLILLCVVSLSSCKSDLEKTINKYAHDKDLYLIQTDIYENAPNGYVTAFYVKNINEIPVDTLYEWEAYEQNEVQIAMNIYLNDIYLIDSLSTYKANMIVSFGSHFDSENIDKKIADTKIQLYNDSTTYANAMYQLSLLKHEMTSLALGYEFDEEFRYVDNGKNEIKTIHKIIYILPNGEVYDCVANLNK